MPRVQWSNGGPQAMLAKFGAMQNDLLDLGETIVRETAAEGAALQAKLLTEATTRTGERRVETGGQSSRYGSVSAGRVDSGLMINQIQSHTERDNNKVSGAWGWFDPEGYFMEQDDGEGNIPPANSLVGSFMVIREKFLQRISNKLRSVR